MVSSHSYNIIMSDSDSEDEHIKLNYSNCIITHNDDSDSADIEESPIKENLQLGSDEFLNFTFDDIQDMKFSVDDTMIFTAGILGQIEQCLNNLDAAKLDWVKCSVNVLRAVLINKAIPFKPATKDPATDLETENVHNMEEKQSVPKQSSSTLRRSQRLEMFAQERELVYCDRLSYTALKLPSGSSVVFSKVPYEVGEIILEDKGNKGQSRRSLPMSRKARKSGNSDENTQSVKERSKSLGTTSLKRNTRYAEASQGASTSTKSEFQSKYVKDEDKGSYKRRARSMLPSSSKNTTCGPKNQKNKNDSKKRRAVSLDGGFAKKAKVKEGAAATLHKPQKISSEKFSRSTSRSDKRMLYSPEQWLSVFSIDHEQTF